MSVARRGPELRAESGVEAVRRRVQVIASTLLEQLSIPAVKQQEPLLRQVASDEWWVDVTLPTLELVRRRLRSLVALIPKGERRVVYADFEDELGELARVELTAITSGAGFERFKAKARAFLREHEDHLALQKVRRNAQLTDADLAELERMLVDSGVGTQEDLERAAMDAQGLGLFIRSLVGLEREAAQQALAGFLEGRTLTANQVEFVGLVLSGLTENGVLLPARLYESPFTDVAAEGPEAIFGADDVDALVVALDRVRDAAVPLAASDIA